MQLAGSLLIAIVLLWSGIGAFFRLSQDAPMGFHTQSPGAEYDRGLENQIEGQHRFVKRWFRLWPAAIATLVVAAGLIALG